MCVCTQLHEHYDHYNSFSNNLVDVSVIKVYPDSAANDTDVVAEFCGDLKRHSLKQQVFF